jgi:hypothetical protein
MDLYISFLKIEIAKHFNQDVHHLEQQFAAKRKKVNLPMLSDSYFQNYFKV